jgi:hypothetical protein
METNSLKVEQLKVTRPLYSDEQIPEAKPATLGHSSASEQVQPPKKSDKENYAADSICDSRYMSFEVDDGGDPPIQFELRSLLILGILKDRKSL